MLLSLSLPTLNGNKSQWVKIKIDYKTNNPVFISFENGTKANSIVQTDNQVLDTTRCGTYQYSSINKTIEFIVTSESDCTLRITQSSSANITLRLNIDINTFNTAIGKETFIDQISSYLQIESKRITILSIIPGSTIVNFAIIPDIGSPSTASSLVPNNTELV
jgi:hypothetical protein